MDKFVNKSVIKTVYLNQKAQELVIYANEQIGYWQQS